MPIFSRGLLLLLSVLGLYGCANACERLCEAYFQLELRCDLLTCESGSVDGASCPDENVAIQNTEYLIQQCQADYRQPKPGDDGQPSEEDSCDQYLSQVDDLLSDYDSANDELTQQALCEQFVSLQQEMGLN